MSSVFLTCWLPKGAVVRADWMIVLDELTIGVAAAKFFSTTGYFYLFEGLVGIPCGDILRGGSGLDHMPYELTMLKKVISISYLPVPPSICLYEYASLEPLARNLINYRCVIPSYKFWYLTDEDFLGSREIFRFVEARGNGRKGWNARDFHVRLNFSVNYQPKMKSYTILNCMYISFEDMMQDDILYHVLSKKCAYKDEHILWIVRSFKDQIRCSLDFDWLGGTRYIMQVTLNFQFNLQVDFGQSEPYLNNKYLYKDIQKTDVFIVDNVEATLRVAWVDRVDELTNCHKPKRFEGSMYNTVSIQECCGPRLGHDLDLNHFMAHKDHVVISNRRYHQLDWLVNWKPGNIDDIRRQHRFSYAPVNDRESL